MVLEIFHATVLHGKMSNAQHATPSAVTLQQITMSPGFFSACIRSNERSITDQQILHFHTL